MTDTEPQDESTPQRVRADGGRSDVEIEREIDYLDVEINLLKPATPFMRDHLRVIWIGFGIWVVTTFGPITATRIAPDLMTTPMPILEFPLHYFLIAIVAPSSALILSVWYAKKRDEIDEKYGIEQVTTEPADERAAAAAADGGTDE
ncbi:DUF4212 domain-containing protein [Halorubrum vacuolatum]|nr:DUF4212 domain-containing protein [Halorubrum vacuolatum]